VGIRALTNTKENWVDQTLMKNLQVVRPRIDHCLITGGAWTWGFTPEAVLGFCITEEDMKDPTPKVTKPRKSGRDI